MLPRRLLSHLSMTFRLGRERPLQCAAAKCTRVSNRIVLAWRAGTVRSPVSIGTVDFGSRLPMQRAIRLNSGAFSGITSNRMTAKSIRQACFGIRSKQVVGQA